MLQHINEYKEKDDIANALEEKMIEKRNNSTYYKKSNNPSFETQEEKEENILMDSDSESDKENDYDDSIIDNDDLMIDKGSSVDSFTNEDLNKEERLYVERLKEAVKSTVDGEDTERSGTVDISDNVSKKTNKQMKSIRYQNNLLLFRLEQAEDTEKRLNNEVQAMKEASSRKEILYVDKIAALESALKKKTKLLVNTLRNKG